MRLTVGMREREKMSIAYVKAAETRSDCRFFIRHCFASLPLGLDGFSSRLHVDTEHCCILKSHHNQSTHSLVDSRLFDLLLLLLNANYFICSSRGNVRRSVIATTSTYTVFTHN